jgi:hypothetical protein
MSKTRRTPENGRSAREVGIEREADELVENGWCVRAGPTEFDGTTDFAGLSPDIYATRKGSVRVVVVETDAGVTDRVEALREAAAARDADFYVVHVDDSGRRVEYDRRVG